MGTRHLKRLRKRADGADPVMAERARRWTLIVLMVFLGLGLTGFGLMAAGIGVPAWAWILR
jgi:hypothetical protein